MYLRIWNTTYENYRWKIIIVMGLSKIKTLQWLKDKCIVYLVTLVFQQLYLIAPNPSRIISYLDQLSTHYVI